MRGQRPDSPAGRLNPHHVKVLTEAGWSDRRIGRLFGVDSHTVAKARCRYRWAERPATISGGDEVGERFRYFR